VKFEIGQPSDFSLPDDPPGSPAAVARGCTCPQAENNFGRGRRKDGAFQQDFVADPHCVVHGFDALFGIDLDDPRDEHAC
jgi:hypothetical protein